MSKIIFKLLSITSLGLGSGVWAADPAPPAPAADGNAIVSPLEGDYTITAGEESGRPTPPEKIKGAVVSITGNTITGIDQTRKNIFGCTFTLDSKATPWVIRMKSTAPKAGEEAVGLVKDGRNITIIYALPGAPAPTEFKTKDKQNMFVSKSMAGGIKPQENKFVSDPADPTTVPPNSKPSGPDSPKPARLPSETTTPSTK